MKSIYSFTVEMAREVEEKTKEKRKNKETGKEEEVEVSQKVKKKIPYEIIVKEPSRRQLEEADMEYSIEISRCVKKGILTKAMLAKKYSDTGGILTEKDAERLVDLYGDLSELEGEAARGGIKTSAPPKKGATQKTKELYGKLALTRRDIVNLESSYQSLFNHTADIKAQNRVILWYMVHLALQKTSDMETAEAIFVGDDFETRIDNYYAMDEEDNKLFRLVQSKLAAIVSFWYFSESVTKEDFDRLISDLDQK
tara:strand:+ start:20 stop:781 length:762 start_codon:yes stop_codon:yes gene_type:complete